MRIIIPSSFSLFGPNRDEFGNVNVIYTIFKKIEKSSFEKDKTMS